VQEGPPQMEEDSKGLGGLFINPLVQQAATAVCISSASPRRPEVPGTASTSTASVPSVLLQQQQMMTCGQGRPQPDQSSPGCSAPGVSNRSGQAAHSGKRQICGRSAAWMAATAAAAPSAHSAYWADADQQAASLASAAEDGRCTNVCAEPSTSKQGLQPCGSCGQRAPGRAAHSYVAMLLCRALFILAAVLFMLLFCSFHWYIHQPPAVARPIRGVIDNAGNVPPQPHFGASTAERGSGSRDGTLASWEELAARHGSEAVVVLGDGRAARPPPAAAGDQPGPAEPPGAAAARALGSSPLPQPSPLPPDPAEHEVQATSALLFHHAAHLQPEEQSERVDADAGAQMDDGRPTQHVQPRIALELATDRPADSRSSMPEAAAEPGMNTRKSTGSAWDRHAFLGLVRKTLGIFFRPQLGARTSRLAAGLAAAPAAVHEQVLDLAPASANEPPAVRVEKGPAQNETAQIGQWAKNATTLQMLEVTLPSSPPEPQKQPAPMPPALPRPSQQADTVLRGVNLTEPSSASPPRSAIPAPQLPPPQPQPQPLLPQQPQQAEQGTAAGVQMRQEEGLTRAVLRPIMLPVHEASPSRMAVSSTGGGAGDHGPPAAAAALPHPAPPAPGQDARGATVAAAGLVARSGSAGAAHPEPEAAARSSQVDDGRAFGQGFSMGFGGEQRHLDLGMC
jgi:hypothetical protein